MAWIHRLVRLAGPTAVLVGMLAMTACANGGSATTATATAACPSSQATTLKTITGTVTKIANGALTIKGATGASSVVLIAATTRYTRLQTVAASMLTAGTTVQILTQPSQSSAPTTAQTIIVQPGNSGQGQGTGGFGQGSSTGGFGQGRGTGSFGQGQGSSATARCRIQANTVSFRGLSGTIKIYNTTNQQLVVTDAQGTPFLIAITATTTIGSSVQGSQADLQTGATVSIRATTTNGGVMARQIQIVATGQGQ